MSILLSTERHLLAAMIAAAKSIVAFTGAGLSTECGIPDFRSPNNPWLRSKPIDFREFMTNEASRSVAAQVCNG